MSVQVEMLEKSMAKLTIEVPEDKVEKALQKSYLKQKNKISIPGFRKGKVPRHMIEKIYGAEIFYEDAANLLIQENYGDAADESGADIVSRASIDIIQIEKGKPFIFTAEVAVRPEVSLGSYKGIPVSKADTEVTEEEIDQEIEQERENNARIIVAEDGTVEDGDTAIIDYEGFVDGKPFEGGKGENHPLRIGSHTFIDTFEEQLIGKSSGDEAEIHVTFPEEYHAEELAGKPAVFQVKIHEIKRRELPELDDEFAQDVSEFDTLEEYREEIRTNLKKRKEAKAKSQKAEEIIGKIVEDASMEIPEPMIETQVEVMLEEFAQGMIQQGFSFDQYMKLTGADLPKIKEQIRPDAIQKIQGSLVLEQIVRDEKIDVTDEEVDAEIKKMAEAYAISEETLKEQMGRLERESMMKDLAVQKAVDFIVDYSIETE